MMRFVQGVAAATTAVLGIVAGCTGSDPSIVVVGTPDAASDATSPPAGGDADAVDAGGDAADGAASFGPNLFPTAFASSCAGWTASGAVAADEVTPEGPACEVCAGPMGYIDITKPIPTSTGNTYRVEVDVFNEGEAPAFLEVQLTAAGPHTSRTVRPTPPRTTVTLDVEPTADASTVRFILFVYDGCAAFYDVRFVEVL